MRAGSGLGRAAGAGALQERRPAGGGGVAATRAGPAVVQLHRVVHAAVCRREGSSRGRAGRQAGRQAGQRPAAPARQSPARAGGGRARAAAVPCCLPHLCPLWPSGAPTFSHQLEEQRGGGVDGDAAVAKPHGGVLNPLLLASSDISQLVPRAAHLWCGRGRGRQRRAGQVRDQGAQEGRQLVSCRGPAGRAPTPKAAAGAGSPAARRPAEQRS